MRHKDIVTLSCVGKGDCRLLCSKRQREIRNSDVGQCGEIMRTQMQTLEKGSEFKQKASRLFGLNENINKRQMRTET